MKLKEQLETVEDFIAWKYDGKGDTLEKIFSNEIEKLGWEKTDTLYSFLGIYVIGLKAFYPYIFTCTKYMIKTDIGTNAYSNKYLRENFEQFEELNTTKELKEYVNNYLTIGNLIPIWPGGNVDRGVFSNCFDIPEIYFERHKRMARALVKVYKDAYMDDIIENKKRLNLDELIKLSIEEYKRFLISIVDTIKFRNHKINEKLVSKT